MPSQFVFFRDYLRSTSAHLLFWCCLVKKVDSLSVSHFGFVRSFLLFLTETVVQENSVRTLKSRILMAFIQGT